jgi:Flp pilus assembly protein TadD
MWSGPRIHSAGFDSGVHPWTYLLNQTVMIARYLQLAIWPHGLTLYYGWPLPIALSDVWPQALMISALVVTAAVALWRRPRLGVIGAWFFVMLAPTSSVVPIATEVGAERRAYLALIAVVIGAVVLWRRITRPWAARITWLNAGALGAVLLALAAGTRARNREYASSLRLAETTMERWPTPAAHSMYGTELAAAGQMADAERHLRQAAPVDPRARDSLATVLAACGRLAAAIDHFRGFIASQPPALDQVVLAHAMLGDALVREGRLAEAAAEYRGLLETRPADTEVMNRLASILIRQQQYGEAIALYGKVLAARPDDVRALMGAGIARASMGDVDEAIALFQRAVDLDPRNPQAQQNLARALALRK